MYKQAIFTNSNYNKHQEVMFGGNVSDNLDNYTSKY